MTEQLQIRFACDVDGEVPWVVSGLQLSERFNQPYQMRVELRTNDGLAEPVYMLGATVAVTLERGDFQRELYGIIESVEDGLSDRDHVLTTVTVVPALMALSQRRNSRIFQALSIKDILVEVLDEALGPYERSIDTGSLSADYPAQEYTVQYRETDLDFVHRLMEEYGITYRFDHVDGAEVMVLLDSDSGYFDLGSLGNEDGTLAVVLAGGGAGEREDVREFYRESKLRSTVSRTLVFDWLDPSSTQEFEDEEAVEMGTPNGAALTPEREDYDHASPTTLYGYRSTGLDSSEVENQVGLRRELHQRDAVTFVGMGTASHMAPGARFELLDHPQADLNATYLVVSVEHAAGDFADPNNPDESYTNRFECIPIEVEWRPARQTPRPRMPSMQTATVVGPAGEEIHTDEHGRIMVQFHWDRRALYNEEASCFIRVVQPWAGNGWGFVFLPRIGMEVAVTFLEGDPDRPVVTGCLYNGDHATPYPLPDDKTKSTIKTESSPGGGGFNELRFEDAAGSEEIFIHAQKDFNEVVLNNHNTTVGANQSNNVDVDQTQTIHGNQSETVDGDQDMTVSGNRTVLVEGDFTETVDGTETRTVNADVTETFAANETRTISGDQTETISGSVTHTISGSVTDTVTGDVTDTISGALSQTITGGVTVTTPATFDVTAAGGITMTAAGGIKMIAPAGFTVIAPGGTKTIDQDFWKFGGGQGDAFSWQIGIAALKLDMVGIAIGHTNIKMEHVGLCVAHTTAELVTADAAKIHTAGAAVMQGYVSLHTFGLLSIF